MPELPEGDLSGTTVGRFTIGARLGAGGMGEVYKAVDTKLKRSVALKRLAPALASDPDYRRRFLAEARSAARVSHQGIATLYDAIEEGSALLLVMEYVDGQTLRQRMTGRMSVDECLGVAEQCAGALAVAHQHGIIHGDIKPDNVMLTAAGQVKVLDFGVARVTPSAAAEATTTSFAAIGTPGIGGTVTYMAPEVLLGKPSDHRADLFSMGVLVYEMLAGRHPFTAQTSTAVADRILHDTPAPIVPINPEVSPVLESVLDKLLAKSPAERYATTEDLLVDLRRLRSRSDTRRAAAPPKTARAGFWGRAARLGTGVALLALGVLAVRGVLPGAVEPGSPFDDVAAGFRASDWIIAVIPSTNPSADDPDMIALNDGLAATLATKLTQLTQAHDLQVIPTSALHEKDIGSVDDARRELGVTLALSFDVQRFGDRIRVNANLIDVVQTRQLEAETIDGALDDLIDLQEQVAIKVLGMLRVELTPREEGVLVAGTEEPRAYNYYVRGRGYLQNYTDSKNVDAAVSLFEEALDADAGYSAGHAGLGEAYWRRFTLTRDGQWLDRARAECEDAIRLDASSAAGHICLGTVLAGMGAHAGAAEEFDQATRLEPTSDDAFRGLAGAYLASGRLDQAEDAYREAIALRPHYWAGYRWLGEFYLRQGRITDAIGNFEEVVRLAPDSYVGFSNLGVAYYQAGSWTEAQGAFERATVLNPDFSVAHSNLGTLYFFAGRFADATRMFQRAVTLNEGSYIAWGNLGDSYYWTPGAREKASEAYRRAVSLAEERLRVNPNDPTVLSHVAMYQTMLGSPERALEYIGRAVALAPEDVSIQHKAAQVYETLGDRTQAIRLLRAAIDAGYSRAEIDVDPLFDELREDARFSEAPGPA